MTKVMFSSNKNPHFVTITEYIENALKKQAETLFFDNRKFFLRESIRNRVKFLADWDLSGINQRLIKTAALFKPDIFLEVGGTRILPETLRSLKKLGIRTALWTTDPPRVEAIISVREYDFVFGGGTEAIELFEGAGVKNLFWLPFACSPDIHHPVTLTPEEENEFSCDIAFVGTVDPVLYPFRVQMLEALSDFSLGIWGPGTPALPPDSKLKALIRGKETPVEIWRKIYQAAKIVICVHYRDSSGIMKCYQASPRVYEAMACGAFLAVDDQKDVRSLFKDRQDLVIFRDASELRQVVRYYLDHPRERRIISCQGQENVLREHTYDRRIKFILETMSK